jgi:hypothetical protein
MSLFDTLNDNSVSLANHIHPNFDLKNINCDLNYFIYSNDEYLNFLVTSELIERLSNIKRKKMTAKLCDGIPFYSHENVLCLDVAIIARKTRQDIDSFLRRIVRRKPLVGEKHIIVVMNFNEICTRYQMNFKSLLEMNYSNACFIFTSTKMQVGIDCLYSFFMTLRIPTLCKNNSQKLMKEILRIYDDTLKLDVNIDHNLTLYAQVSNLNAHINGGRLYVNVFQREISDLIDFLKSSKKKSLDKVISHIRTIANKVLYYSIPDNIICQYIAKKVTSLKKIDKCVAIAKIAKAEENLINSSKKIFVYELLFIELSELLMQSYK